MTKTPSLIRVVEKCDDESVQQALKHPPAISKLGLFDRKYNKERKDPQPGRFLESYDVDGRTWREVIRQYDSRKPAVERVADDAPVTRNIRSVLVSNDDGMKYLTPQFVRTLNEILPEHLIHRPSDHTQSCIHLAIPREGQAGQSRSSRMYHNTLAESVGPYATIVHSRPIDTLRWGVDRLRKKGIAPEETLFFAGPNYGHNADGLRSASGTMGIAEEAMRQGASMAVAINVANPPDNWSDSACVRAYKENEAYLQCAIAELLKTDWRQPVMVSINLPHHKAKGCELTRPSMIGPERLFCDEIITGAAINEAAGEILYPPKTLIGMQTWLGYTGPENPDPKDHSELAALSRGNISISVEARQPSWEFDVMVGKFETQLQQRLSALHAAGQQQERR